VLEEDAVNVLAGKDFALMTTASGKVNYTLYRRRVVVVALSQLNWLNFSSYRNRLPYLYQWWPVTNVKANFCAYNVWIKLQYLLSKSSCCYDKEKLKPVLFI